MMGEEAKQQQTGLSAAALDEFLRPEPVGDDLAGYRDAAAVLACFDVLKLNPITSLQLEPDRLIDELLPLCEPVTEGAGQSQWTLILAHRRTALRAMGSREKMLSALNANPERAQTPIQLTWEKVLNNKRPKLDALSREELAALSTVIDWADDILDGLPTAAEIANAIRSFDLLAPMRRLTAKGFVGRSNELEQICHYVFGAKPASPLFLFGSGGVGKSTLIAQFILADAVPRGAALAYIDLDRPTIHPDSPLTLLLDALNQLRSQVNVPATMVDSIVKEITSGIGRVESERHFESASVGPEWFVDLFARNMSQWLGGRTAVLVVDTMEAAQFLGGDVMSPLVQILLDLDRGMPELRVILSGRTLASEYIAQAFPQFANPPFAGNTDWMNQIPLPGRPVNLTELEPAEARQLLAHTISQANLPPLTEPELDEVIGIVSRNPMCLHLAARVIRDEGVDKLRRDRSEFLTKLKSEKIQALLYGRILGNLHSDDVRKVAYPGLVVRRIDPAVIREVLAVPCGLELNNQRNEQTIFNELQKEAALVETDPVDYSLRHRADVRRVMLQDLLEHVDKSTVDAIDNAAVDFYEKRTGGVARAEEIYHRLRRCDEESILDERWNDDAAEPLRSALEELPAAQKLWLAEKLHVTLDESVRHTADQDAWERQAARSVDRYLRSGSPQQALAILNERKARLPRSPLYNLEAETYRFLGQPDEALCVARAGVESATTAGAIDMALDLLLKMVVIEEVRGNLQAAETLLKEAAAVSPHSANRILQLRVDITALRLQRQLRPADRDERAQMRKKALDELTGEMLYKLRSYPVLLREVAAELAKQDPRIASAAIDTLGVEVSTDEQAQALGQAIANLGQTAPDMPDPDSVLAQGAQEFEQANFNPDVVRKWVTEVMTSKDTRRLGRTLAAAAAGAKTLSGFREYFRAGVSSTLHGRLGPD